MSTVKNCPKNKPAETVAHTSKSDKKLVAATKKAAK